MTKSYKLPPLGFAYQDLEPYLDAKTVEIHYTKHHQAYLDTVNLLLKKYPQASSQSLEDSLRNLSALPMNTADKLRFKNNAGGYLNHNLYWKILGPQKQIDHVLAQNLKREFGSVEEFKNIFSQTATEHFASGWVWLVNDEYNKLKIYSLPNHDSPYSLGHVPILVLDVWEHAYYLSYQNKRASYINNWWNILTII
jgi:superoxide dismutase, Fe-Mn family